MERAPGAPLGFCWRLMRRQAPNSIFSLLKIVVRLFYSFGIIP